MYHFLRCTMPTLKNVGLPCSYLRTQTDPTQKIYCLSKNILFIFQFLSYSINKPFFKIIKHCILIEERLQRLLLYAFLPYIQHLQTSRSDSKKVIKLCWIQKNYLPTYPNWNWWVGARQTSFKDGPTAWNVHIWNLSKFAQVSYFEYLQRV